MCKILANPLAEADFNEISRFVGNTLWDRLCEWIETSYSVKPLIEYSKCSLAAGWNVKYKKSGKALCTLYPEKGGFTCLVVVGRNEDAAVLQLLGGMDVQIGKLYHSANAFNGARWLMVQVTSDAVLQDVKTLITLRAPSPKSNRQ